MAYMVIDIFSDRNAADVRAASYKQSGRQNVTLKVTNGITVNDCTVDPCIAKHDQDGNPLYIVLAEGD